MHLHPLCNFIFSQKHPSRKLNSVKVLNFNTSKKYFPKCYNAFLEFTFWKKKSRSYEFDERHQTRLTNPLFDRGEIEPKNSKMNINMRWNPPFYTLV